MGTLTQEQVDRLRMTPEKSEDFLKILERHPEHKTGDMSAVWREQGRRAGSPRPYAGVPTGLRDPAPYVGWSVPSRLGP